MQTLSGYHHTPRWIHAHVCRPTCACIVSMCITYTEHVYWQTWGVCIKYRHGAWLLKYNLYIATGNWIGCVQLVRVANYVWNRLCKNGHSVPLQNRIVLTYEVSCFNHVQPVHSIFLKKATHVDQLRFGQVIDRISLTLTSLREKDSPISLSASITSLITA